MGSRDKDTKSLHDKLKQYFKKNANAPPPVANELSISAELERELGAETPLHRRLKVLRDLNDKVLHTKLEMGGVERLWRAIRDMLEDTTSTEARHASLGFLCSLVEGQADQLVVMRTVLIRWLKDTHSSFIEDSQLRFKLLHALTNGGKNIRCFEEEIGPVILEWLPLLQNPAHLVEFLELVTNVIKYNAAYLDEDIVSGIVSNCSYICCMSASEAVVRGGMQVLVAVVSYTMFPLPALRDFVYALCRTVNVEKYCQDSWKVMRYVLGADVGHAALLRLLEALAAGAGAGDAGLARGAVFYINTALWGARRPHALRVPCSAVLPAFRAALEAAPTLQVLTYEVILAVQALLTRCHHELDDVTNDAVLLILNEALNHIESYNPPNELISSRFHDVVTLLEQLVERQQYRGPEDMLYDLVDRCGHDRPEASVTKMVTYKLEWWCPGVDGWPDAAARLCLRYVRDARAPVRLLTLHAAHQHVARHRSLHDDALERIALPVLKAASSSACSGLRAATARVLTELATPTSDHVPELLDLLETILNRRFSEDPPLPAETPPDVSAALKGLLELFHRKLFTTPAAHAIRVYLILLQHVELHYKKPNVFLHHTEVRSKILELLLSVRISSTSQVGFCYPPDGVRYSPHVTVGPAVSLARGARAVSLALTHERSWPVLRDVLHALPKLLQHRPRAARHPDVDLLADMCVSMLTDKSQNYPERLIVMPSGGGGGGKLSSTDFQNEVLPVLASLAPHHHCLEPQTQQRIIRCLLKYGIVMRQPAPYIVALTLFTLETRDAMVKMLPEVLLDLSKISDTAVIAGPMLEFLSTLTRLPKVFASFVEDQYMSVFAIILPYTNPARYNHYVVSLAHHVIAAWFLKCRLSYRRNFVTFIIHGLHNYIIVPCEEQLFKTHHAGVNEDSSNRKRSSSLGSRGVSATPRAGGGAAAFHLELTETCVDLLARYTFTPCSVKPQRSPTVEFLLGGGESQTWLVGHKLVTITTSGCQQNSLRQGLCDRCALLCKQHMDNIPSPNPEPDLYAQEIKRYSKRSLQHSRSTDTSTSLSDTLLPPSGASSRQNSSENKSASDSGADVQQLSSNLEHLSVQDAWCPCWCSGWAEVTVRAPTGDVSWVCRMQNQMNFDQLLENPLQDVVALLAPSLSSESSASSGLGDDDQPQSSSESVAVSEKRERPAPAPAAPPQLPPLPPPPPAHRSPGTEPINIPLSPQRQSSSSTDDDDTLISVQDGKSRHPVRRSNSSPEMSSSWKSVMKAECQHDVIVLPSCEPASTSASLHASKKQKKSELRVSCEAIPEEQAPPAHPAHHTLMTYNSDPGSAAAASDTALHVLLDRGTHHTLQKVASDGAVVPSPEPPSPPDAELPPLARSKRSHTISVMSPTRRRREAVSPKGRAAGGGGGVTPGFLLLQLYHNIGAAGLSLPGAAGGSGQLSERPLLVSGEQHERSIKTLDLVPPVETYKVGVLYVGPGQHDNEVAILRNQYGSLRYSEFVKELGAVVDLETDDPALFLNLERGGQDGTYTYVWHDDIMQVHFHVATSMPNCERDPSCNEKRKYIGNDYVSIVYNDSGQPFNILTIKGQLNFCIVLVEPLEHNLCRVQVRTKDERVRSKFLTHLAAHVITDHSAPLLARQLALHCTLASLISSSLTSGGAPYASNSLERLRIIKRLRARLQASRGAARAHSAPYSRTHLQPMDDFTDYT